MRVCKTQIQKARVADLYSYLLQYHPDTVTNAGFNRIKNKYHDSLVITRNKGYCHNSTQETGNGIDYLTKHLGYSFQRAVICLAKHDGSQPIELHNTSIVRPTPLKGAYTQAFAYLKNRGISDNVIQALIKDRLIYQEDKNNNICFAADDFIEIHGSLSDKPYKSIATGSAIDGYWVFGAGDKATTTYVCESSIDALSLYCLQAMEGKVSPSNYCSMAGLKQTALERIKRECKNVCIAVDNDDAGNTFAEANTDLARIIPIRKDWNDDLRVSKKMIQ